MVAVELEGKINTGDVFIESDISGGSRIFKKRGGGGIK